ncbi:MAG: threonine-phosphate decarboxylase CobD [Bacillota bacterium]|nr:threonine-phosphate decarboxylase CobD [Bacillota bacterium]
MNKEMETGGHGGDLTGAAKRFGVRPEEFCDFSSNINPLGPPEGLFEELKKHLDDILHYPPPQARELRRMLSLSLKIDEERLLLGNGANELIHLFFLWKRPSRVIIPSPTFAEYERAARLVDSAVERFPLPLEKPFDLKLLSERLCENDLLVFCNPNNPTGTCYPRELLENMVKEAYEKGASVLLDESFLTFTGRSLEESLSHCDYPNLWVVTSLTKLWALPGLRLGYIIGHPQKMRALTQNGDPWRVNTLAQRAGIYCLSQEDYLTKSLELIVRERNFLMGELQKMDKVRVFKGEANFLLLRGEEDRFSSNRLFLDLAARAILIRNASNFSGLDERYFRIAVRSRSENEKLLKELWEVFRNYKI